MAEDNSKYFELYITSEGAVQVSSDVKLKILHELSEGDLSLTELSKKVSKAQSTISVHLDSMVEDKLISVHDDLQDNRKKYYSLISLPFGKSVPSSDESRDLAFGILGNVAKDPEMMLKAMPWFVFLGFDGVGLNVDPMARILGFIHGASLSGSLTGKDLEETIGNAREYLKKMGFGEASIYSVKPLTIIIKNSIPLTEGSANCMIMYAASFFCKILEDATGKPHEMVSSEVFGTDFNYLRFVLEPRMHKIPLLEEGFEGQ
ncbi:winged helix-turn-helix domain-containing protein [Methanomassiliicoccales archaeon LGM-RCC1]|nr:winged helix-turn-helix domain-containing protein [Methanomassiliicoccales archaeon LGM-RCC1]